MQPVSFDKFIPHLFDAHKMTKQYTFSALFFSFFLSASFVTFGQGTNLVQNGSFEDTVLTSWQYWMPQHWDRPPGSITTPDLYMTGFTQDANCNSNSRGIPQNSVGYSHTKEGNAYMGMLYIYTQGNQVNSREYIQTQLTSPLVAGSQYKVGMYVKRASNSRLAINSLGILLSSTAPNQPGNQYIVATPQIQYSGPLLSDTTNWTLVSGVISATGGEQYLTIGNFKDDASSNVTIANPNAPGGALAGCWFNYFGAYYFMDSVFLMRLGETAIDNVFNPQIEVYPNPTTDILYLSLPADIQGFEWEINSLGGSTLLRERVTTNSCNIAVHDLSVGIYMLTIRYKDHVWRRRINKM